jgi:hypothetical protein
MRRGIWLLLLLGLVGCSRSEPVEVGGSMSENRALDVQQAHRYFSAECFNGTWDLLDKSERTSEEEQQMIEQCLASVWHWTQRDDCTDTNMSIGYWQASRVYAVVGLADEARRYGQLCLDVSNRSDVPPFYVGYAHEALARAEVVAGNAGIAATHLAEARRVAGGVTDPEAKKMLTADLDELEGRLGA